MLTALENWVELGRAPDGIIASGKPTPNCDPAMSERTMPLCTFPGIATYKGSGEICDASSWICNPLNQDLLGLVYGGRSAGLPYTYLDQ